MKTDLSRFMRKVEITPGCWSWKAGTRGADNYGCFGIHNGEKRVMIGAHIFSFMKFIGPVNGLCVLHECDNRLCVNPKHLFLGTHGDNARDCVSKGRNAFGERSGTAKLTWEKVRRIRAAAGTQTQQSLADEMGVSQPVVSRVIHNKIWKERSMPSLQKPDSSY